MLGAGFARGRQEVPNSFGFGKRAETRQRELSKPDEPNARS